MQVERINNSINFTGKIIYPEKLTPEIEKFKSLAHETISQIIQNEPYDIYVKSKKSGDKVFVGIKATDKEKTPNDYYLYLIYEAIKSAKDKMLLEEVKEFMEKSIIKAEITEELILKENIKQSRFIPRKIGTNREISSRPKFKTKHSKRN